MIMAGDMKSLLFFDIDGTLISEVTKTIPESAIAAIHKAQENGHLAFVNTGRPFSHIDPKVLTMGFSGYACSCGMYIRLGDSVIQEVRLPRERCDEIRDCARGCRVELGYESEDGLFYDATMPVSAESQEERQRLKAQGVFVSGDVDGPDFRFEKFIAWKEGARDLPRFLDFISDDFQMIDRGKFYECLPKGYSKAKAMERVRDLLGLPEARTYAFGDGPNDVEMIRAADIGIIVGNAPDHVKREADFVTREVERDGIEYALERFGLI